MASVEGCGLALSSIEGSRAEVDLAALVEAYSSLLFRVAHSVLRSGAEAEDVVQDVFGRVLEHRQSLSFGARKHAGVAGADCLESFAGSQTAREAGAGLMRDLRRSLVMAKSLPADKALDEARRMAGPCCARWRRLPEAERHVCSAAFGC